MSTKFGLLIDFDLLKTVTSTNTKPELLFSGHGSHLENRNDVIFLHINFGVEQLYTGNLLTVVLAHLYAQLARRIYSLAVALADSI